MPLFEYKCPNGHNLLFFQKGEPDQRIGCPIKECIVGSDNESMESKLTRTNSTFKYLSGSPVTKVQTLAEQTMATLVGEYKG